jgi:nucleoside-diphosphate-sugar epimerase
MNKQQNILITGSTGFVGSNLKPYLQEEGFHIIGVTRNPTAKDELSYESLNVENWSNSSAMLHLAGKAHDVKNTAEDAAYFEVNTELTKKLFNQFLESTCEVFIYISSVKAVADTVDGILKEDEIPNAITAYGKSKLAAEQFILAQKIPKGKSVFILRPCMIHGPGNKGNLNLLFAMANKGVPYPFGAFHNERSFLSIDNLLFVIKELIVKRPTSGIFNVSDDEFISTKEVYKAMGEAIGSQLRILNVPKGLIALCGKLGDVIPIPINSEKIHKLTENYKVSNAKIKKALEISNLPMSAKEGLYKTLESFKS